MSLSTPEATSEVPETRETLTQSPRHHLSIKSLIAIGIFSAVYFVILGATSMMGMISPVFHLLGISASTLINAFVIMALQARSPHFGTMTILGTLVSGVIVLMGQFWGAVFFGAGFGLLADLVNLAGRHRSRIAAIWSYGVLQLWLIGPLMPVFLTPDAFFSRIVKRRGEAYVEVMQALFTPSTLVIFHVVNALFGVLMAFLATRALKRYFEKTSVL
ncbi:MptD family putative ECF transporter S component [Schaalia sp. ZJ1691]|uniref:MptD family putative ECF transporter S component n=1 Tax=Schaalia sp. ZJ1691 TaxID=2709404 RepID=UPI0013EB1A71|nr:MptD family putative ECF transporter S component [Schaalia sp. ZJ1691]